jgi:hypothetical protein
MQRGYVKVWRKIEDSGLMQMPNTLALFMFLLLNATHKDKKVGTTTGIIELKRGQYISGRKELAARLKQTEQQIRTSIDRLVQLQILSVFSTNKYSVYVIENYSKYQDEQESSNQQATNKQPTDNQQTTTKQECKKERSNTLVLSQADDNCPHQKIIDLYHEKLPMLNRVKVWNAKRQSQLRTRWKEETSRQNLDYWERLFEFIAESDYLTGKINGWRADLEWITNSTNFTKIIEGTYKNRKTA